MAAPGDLLHQLQTVTWVDHTALGVLLVFFVLGLFKGLIWQVSRIAILVAAYVVAGRFGADVANALSRPPLASPAPAHAASPAAELVPVVPNPAAGTGVQAPAETTLYLAYVLLFLAVLVVLSFGALLLQKLATKAGLGFFDRLGGGVLGVATGACVVLFGLFVVHMFFRGSQLAMAAEGSHSLRLSKRAIDWLGPRVPDELREVFALVPLHSAAADPQDDSLAPLPGTSPDPGGPVVLPPPGVPGSTPVPERPKR